MNDASGDPLVEADASGATTLFLGSEDVTVTGSGSSAAVSKVVRYYSIGGTEVAFRVNSAGPSFVESDLQGTNRVTYTPSAAGSSPEAKVSRAFVDPYGNGLSATTASDLVAPTLVTGRSFLNAPADGDTGLVSLGVRKYDPVTGAFLSVDPVKESSDPGQLNGYSYGGGNPVTHADPTGAMYPSGGGGGENGPHSYGCHGSCGWSRNARRRYDARAAANRRWEWAHWAAERRAIDAQWAREARVARAREQATQYFLTHGGWRFIPPVPAPSPHRSFVGSLVHAVGTGISDAAEWAWHHKAQVVTVTAIVALTVANVAQLGLDPATDAAEAGAIGEEGALIAADGTEDGAAAEEDAAASCGGQSFTASTKVVLADGSAVALAAVRPGQKVKATDPKTGKSSVRTVDKVWVNRDTDLMDVTVSTRAGSSVVHTTARHPFWDVTTRAWTDADHLRAGDKLMSAAGIRVTVSRTRVIPGVANMWDLTVDGLHDFYILTTPTGTRLGSTAASSADIILVHNCPDVAEDGEPAIGGEAANYGDDELAQFAFQHSGQGYANGEVRPSLDDIQGTISNGVRTRLPDQNAIRIQTPSVRVIINEDQPWKSTAYYR